MAVGNIAQTAHTAGAVRSSPSETAGKAKLHCKSAFSKSTTMFKSAAKTLLKHADVQKGAKHAGMAAAKSSAMGGSPQEIALKAAFGFLKGAANPQAAAGVEGAMQVASAISQAKTTNGL